MASTQYGVDVGVEGVFPKSIFGTAAIVEAPQDDWHRYSHAHEVAKIFTYVITV